ncbi:hypothetical protein BSL78_14520 [Apostichopus japonicus]|uniref:Uncharacterized protein n=1 Tax=Stichopus japonicus TaxID=307972 RepID=A0A2G8KKZ2_STIJA|nr:hypothetical protein BSL78_14520 [Apostichopus japonicus]
MFFCSSQEHFFSDKGRQSGYIQDRLKNLRRYIPESAKKRTSTANTSNELPAKQMELGGIVVEPLPDENATKLASFCKRAAPDLKKDIVKAMADIHGNFSKWILEEAPTAYEVLQEYPRFKDIDELVNQHFRIKFSSDISKQLLLKWESVIAPVIMKLAASTTTADVHHLYGECHVDVSEELNSEVLAMYSFLLLVLFLPSTPRNRGSQKQTMKLLIDFQPIGVVLEEYLLQKKNQTQPYLLCIGTKKAPSQFFIIVDSHAIPCQENIVSAIDKLFKLHYVFNIHYAQQLRMFYMFMDSVVYGIVP